MRIREYTRSNGVEIAITFNHVFGVLFVEADGILCETIRDVYLHTAADKAKAFMNADPLTQGADFFDELNEWEDGEDDE